MTSWKFKEKNLYVENKGLESLFCFHASASRHNKTAKTMKQQKRAMMMFTGKFKLFSCSYSQIIIHCVSWVQILQYLLCTNHIFLENCSCFISWSTSLNYPYL